MANKTASAAKRSTSCRKEKSHTRGTKNLRAPADRFGQDLFRYLDPDWVDDDPLEYDDAAAGVEIDYE